MDYPGSKNKLSFDAIDVCRQCGLGIVKTSKTQEEIDRIYSDGDYWHKIKLSPEMELHYYAQSRHRLKSILSFVDRNKALKILDVGAGQGFILEALRITKVFHTYEYFFLEPDNESAASIEKNGGKRVKGLSETESKFDVIFLNHVLEHVLEPDIMLQSLRKLLNKDGILYIEVPNSDYKFKNDVFPHTLFFTDESLEKLARNNGFETNPPIVFGRKSVEKRTGLFDKAFNFILYHLTAFSLKHRVNALALIANDIRFGYNTRLEHGIWLSLIAKPSSQSNH